MAVSLMNGTNGSCVDHDITCRRPISFNELYPTTPPMYDYFDPSNDPTIQCQPCPCTEMEHSTTTGTPMSTTDYHTSQYPHVPISNEPTESNTNSPQISNVIKERDNLWVIAISLGVLVGILSVLLVVVTSGWVWTCWTMKRTKATTPEHVRYTNDNNNLDHLGDLLIVYLLKLCT